MGFYITESDDPEMNPDWEKIPYSKVRGNLESYLNGSDNFRIRILFRIRTFLKKRRKVVSAWCD